MTTTTQVTQQELARIVMQYQGNHIFSAKFIKRTTGEERIMVCRKKVQIGLTGRGLNYNPTSKGLMGIWDVAKKGYRMISLDGLLEAQIDGFKYVVGE